MEEFIEDIWVDADFELTGRFTSSMPESSGYSPFSIVNSLLNVNLNADYVDGYHALQLIDRAYHIGEQAISTVTGLQTALDGKQASLTGSGLVKSTGGTISYVTDNSANWDSLYAGSYDIVYRSTVQNITGDKTFLGVLYFPGPEVTDLNTPSGFRFVRSSYVPANSPGAGFYQGIQFSGANNSDYTNQLLYHEGGALFTRTKYAGTWGDWYNVWTSSNFTSTDISNWNTAYANNHTHANKSILDTIVNKNISQWTNDSNYVTSTSVAGTANYYAKFTSANAVGNGDLYQGAYYLTANKPFAARGTGGDWGVFLDSSSANAVLTLGNTATSQYASISYSGSSLIFTRTGQPNFTIESTGRVSIEVTAGTPPLRVNSTVMTPSLNADLLDDQHGTYYLSRANHTGTQAWSTITATPTTLAGYGITDAFPAVELVSDFNTPVGYKTLRGSSSTPTNQPSASNWGQGWQVSSNNDSNHINQLVFDIFGILYTRTKYISWGVWNKVLTSADITSTNISNWNTAYSNSHVAVTISTANGLSISGQALSLQLASGSQPGALSASDWSTFNNKQAGLYGSGIVKTASGVISYITDNSANWDAIYNAFVPVGISNHNTNTSTGVRQWSAGATNKPGGDYGTVFTFIGGSYTGLSGNSVSSWINQLAADTGNVLWFRQSINDWNNWTPWVKIWSSQDFTSTNISNWNTAYSNTHSPVTIGTSNGLSLSGQSISLQLSSGSQNGALSSGDWNTFNGKQAALSGSGLVKSSGGSISYVTDNSGNWNTAFGWGNHASYGYVTNVVSSLGYTPMNNDRTITINGNTQNLRDNPSFTISSSGGTVTGSGTTNYVAKWTSGTSLGDSIISATSGTVTIAGNLQVNSSIQTNSFLRVYGGATFYTNGVTVEGTSNFNNIEIMGSALFYSGGSSMDSSAKVQIDSTSKGFLAPRMTKAQRLAISSPAVGLLIYQTDDNTGFKFHAGSGLWFGFTPTAA